MANEKKTDYVLLGLLSHEPRTGYEIKKILDSTMHFFWNASFGSIYPTLQKLEQDGKIQSTRSQDTGREKITYEITPLGREYLKEWLKKPVVKDELRFETLLKLFFGSEVGAFTTLEHIEAFEEKIQKELPILTQYVDTLKAIDSESAHRYYMFTAMFGVKVHQAYLEWCDEIKQYLKKEGEQNV